MDSAAPVVVGIDGSKASVRAALWAADEAALRDTALDLIYVVDPVGVADLDKATAMAHHAIHRAWDAVTASDKHVKIESEVLHGNPILELANAARRAALLCVGHKGMDDSAPMGRGSTASNLARMTPTSVAVIRRRHKHPPTFRRWVVAVLDESPRSHQVLQTALEEATLRDAPVLALTTWSTTSYDRTDSPEPADDIRAKMDRYLRESHDDSADVQVCALPMPSDLTTVLEQSASIEQLFVVDSARHDLVDQLTCADARRAMRKTNCSILVVHADPPTAARVPEYDLDED